MRRLRLSDEETFRRFREWFNRDFRTLTDEHLLIAADAVYYPTFWRTVVGTLYLTNKRLLFASIAKRLFREDLEINLPQIDEIDVPGDEVRLLVSLRSFGLLSPWFVTADHKRYCLATSRQWRYKLLDELADLTGLVPKEPHAT